MLLKIKMKIKKYKLSNKFSKLTTLSLIAAVTFLSGAIMTSGFSIKEIVKIEKAQAIKVNHRNLETVDASKLIELINQKTGERNIYIGRESCPACEEFKPILEKAKTDKKIYYFDADEANDEELREVKEALAKLDLGINSVPALIKLNNGINSKFERSNDITKIEEFLNK